MRTLLAFLLCASAGFAHEISVSGTRFLLDGKPFPFHGLTFFHAVYNQAFNRSPAERRAWLEKFGRYKIHVLRVWANGTAAVATQTSATTAHCTTRTDACVKAALSV
jgi:hypothetical protein